jgi:flagellin-like hook-associated protein FlgL
MSFIQQNAMAHKYLSSTLTEHILAGERVAAKRNLLNPEDGPSAYISAYSIQRTVDNLAQYGKNAGVAGDWLKNANDQLLALSDLLKEVRFNDQLAGNNEVNDLDSYKALAGDILGAFNTLFDIANTQYMGKYMFGGYETNTKPFRDQESAVSSPMKLSGADGMKGSTRPVFNDLAELSDGNYTIEMVVKGDTGYLSILDKNGTKMMLDSNGTDEAATSGNSIATEISFKLEPGKIINTGRGMAIQIPDNITEGFRYNVKYTAGDPSTYYGDLGTLMSQIGFNQDVGINFPGSDIFTATFKTLRSSLLNTVGGVSLTASSLFSHIMGANAGGGDTIKISGTDHKGNPVGAAKLMGADGVRLNMTHATKEERTLTIGYAGKFYQIEIPAKGYQDMDELLRAVNGELPRAIYAGSQDLVIPPPPQMANYLNADDMATSHNLEINAGLNNSAGLQVDLSEYIKVNADGNRLEFVTTEVGNKTALTVTGFKHNTLGFDDKTIAAVGKDTVFEVGQDFSEENMNIFYTQHANVDMNQAKTYFVINGESIVVEGLDTATSLEERELLIDNAIRRAGFGTTVTTRLEETGTAGVYDLTFTMQNMNYGRDTFLGTTYYNPAGPTSDYQAADLPNDISATPQEHRISDLLRFVEDLYGNTVTATVENGYLEVKDSISGESRMTIKVTTGGEGMSYPIINQQNVLTGKYTGGTDDRWNIGVEMINNADGTRDVNVTVKNRDGDTIMEKYVTSYQGEGIRLLSGVILQVDDMDLAPGTDGYTQFDVELRAGNSLSFGDMYITEPGKNVNMFSSLMNLYNALNNGIANVDDESGIGVPSAWRDEALKSSAIPYFEGAFTGNSNAQWNYQVVGTDGRRDFYLQNEFAKSTGQMRLMPGATSLDFEVQTYDNNTGALQRRTVSVDITGVTTNEELQNAIVSTINNNPVFHDEGIRAEIGENGSVSFLSGSGSRNIVVKPVAEKDAYMFGNAKQTALPMADPVEMAEPSTLTFEYVDGGGLWQTATVTIPAGSYTPAQIQTDINTALAGTGITAGLNSTGALTFNGTTQFYMSSVDNPGGGLGISNSSPELTAGTQKPKLDMRNLSAEERTLTFRYSDGVTEHTANITLEPKEYGSHEEMVAEMNGKLAAIGLDTVFEAVPFGTAPDNTIAFSTAPGYFASIEGDHAGTLGFPRTGDRVNITVQDEKGNAVQSLWIDSANEEYMVADGVMVGFDAGSLYATDSFTSSVGSGVGYELGVLDQAISQMLQVLTQVGNRASRVESVMEFHVKMQEAGEIQKARYLGSSLEDQAQAIADLEVAKIAYESAIKMTAQMMSVSLMDYMQF